MSLPISALSIRRPVPALVAFAVLLILGLVAFRSLPVTRLPNIDIPIVQIAITQSGAAPAELETQVTKKVEDAVAGVPGIWHILSAVSDGSSVTTIQFDIGTNVDRALNDVKDQIAKIRVQLPRTIDEPIIQRFDVEGLPIVTYAVSSHDRSTEQISWFVDETVARELQTIRGVGQVSRSGGVDREIRVALDPRKLLGARRHGGQRIGRSCAPPTSTWRAAAARSPDRSRRSGPSPAPARCRIWRPCRSSLRGGRHARDSTTSAPCRIRVRRAAQLRRRSTADRSWPSGSRVPRAPATPRWRVKVADEDRRRWRQGSSRLRHQPRR